MSNFYKKMGSFFCCCSEPSTLVGYDETATMYHSINRKEKSNGYDATKETEKNNLTNDQTDDPKTNDESTANEEPTKPKPPVRKASQADLRKTIVNVKTGGSGEEGPYKIAKEIALSSDGYIAVVEHAHEKVYLYEQDGTYKCTMKSPSESRETRLLYPTDVTFTPYGEIAVADQTNYVKIFNKEGQFLSSFNIKGDQEKGDRPKAYSIDVTVDKHIIVGDVRRKVITVHAEKDGTFVWERTVHLNIEPHFLATTTTDGHQHVLVCDWKAGVVNAIDLEADDDNNVIFQLDSFDVNGNIGVPKGVAYDKDGHFFLAVSQLDDSTENTKKNVFANTGQIHQYSSTGEFENCLYNGLAHPRGIAWSNEFCSLYIANTRSVIILDV